MSLEPKKLSKKFDIIKNNLIFAAPFNLCFEQGSEGKTALLGAEKFCWKSIRLLFFVIIKFADWMITHKDKCQMFACFCVNLMMFLCARLRQIPMMAGSS